MWTWLYMCALRVCMSARSPGEHARAEWFKHWQEIKINVIYFMRHCLDCARDNSSHLKCRRNWIWKRILKEKEGARAVIHSRCLWNYAWKKVFKLLYNYLMKKYELYIIIIFPVTERDWDGAAACHAKCLTAGASSAWDRFYEIGLFKDRPSKIPTRLSADSDP